MGYTHCPHGPPFCAGLGVGPKIERAWGVSSWRHGAYLGGEASVSMLYVKVAFGVFSNGSERRYQLGVGLGF